MPIPTQFSQTFVIGSAGVCLLLGIIVGVSLRRPSYPAGSVVQDARKPTQSQADSFRYWAKIEVHLVDGETLIFRSADCEASEQRLEIRTYNQDHAVFPMQQVRFYTVSEQHPEPLGEPPSAGGTGAADSLLHPATKS